MDARTAAHYNNILEKSKRYWMQGGTVDPGTADEVLAAYPLAAVTGKSGRYDGRDIVQFMGYPDDMPSAISGRCPLTSACASAS